MFTSFRGPYEVIYNRVKKYAKYFSLGTVLDIGCGRGEFLQVLKENTIDNKGLDNDKDLVNGLKEKGFNISSIGFKEFETEKKYSGVMASHIIEHIPGLEVYDFLKKLNSLLEINGVLVIITPNFQNLEVATETFWRDIEHQRPYPLSLLGSLLVNNGFEVVEKGFDEDTGYKGIKKMLRKFKIFGKYFTPKDIFIVGKKIKEI
ncbi:class I SAM-dependent methyltransferase [bacterium]|nr:class I SAM-dependent methyltransferase [bacterium]